MPVQLHESGAMSFTGEDGVGLYRLVTLYHSLKVHAALEQVRTGMKVSRVSAVACAKRLGYKGRTAKALLEDIERKHPELKRN
jgi:hypothetical protein